MKNKWFRRILITAILVALIWFVLPLFFNKRVNETRQEITSPPANSQNSAKENLLIAGERSGTFTGVAGHQSSGVATLISSDKGNFIRLEDNFSVTSGPDLYVYVGDKNGKTKEIARLKGNQGGQNYQLPADVSPDSFDTVWIYCKAFTIDFAKAELTKDQ